MQSISKPRPFLLMIILTVLSMMLCSCASTGQATTPPPGCESSLIYAKIPAPKLAGAGALIATSELSNRYPEAKKYMLGAFMRVLHALGDDRITYLELAQLALQNVKWVNENFGNRLMVYSEILSVFDQPIPIDHCDRELIEAHLNKQLLYLGG